MEKIIATYSAYLWRLTLLARSTLNNQYSLAVIGVDREDRMGRLVSKPLSLGRASDNADFIRKVGSKLLAHREELGVSGCYKWNNVQTEYKRPAQQVWSICWTIDQNDEGGSLPWFLSKLSYDQINELSENVIDPSNVEFLKNVKLVAELVRENYFEFREIVTQFGSPTSREWFVQAGSFAQTKIDARKQEEHQFAQQQERQCFGEPSFVIDVHAVTRKYKTNIPPGILLHMTKFAQPPVEHAEILLSAFLRVADEIPDNSYYSMENSAWLPGYLVVLKWIFSDRERQVFELLKASGSHESQMILDWLKALSVEGLKDISGGLIRHSHGMGIAKFKLQFDPDMWR